MCASLVVGGVVHPGRGLWAAPMVTAATVDASAVWSAGRYGLSSVVCRARCLQAAVQATTLQFVRSRSAPSVLLLPLC